MKRKFSHLDTKSINNETSISSKMVRHLSPQSHHFKDKKANFKQQQISTDSCVKDETCQSSSRSSVILGSFSQPPTYVIHFLDSNLTILQSFQICSLFGRVRIHGLNLCPLKFYSVYNYRTNSPLSIESVISTKTISLQDIKLFMNNEQLTDSTLNNVQQYGGDILLIRKELNNNLLFINTLHEFHLYNEYFFENYKLFEIDKWKQLEQDLYIRFIETTDKTSIIPCQTFVTTVDHIIHRWLNETTEDYPFVVLICGEKDLGKSTFTRYVINRCLNHINSQYDLTYFDCDIGQCEFTMSGCLSYVYVDSPLLGPPCSHMKSNPNVDCLLYYGLVSPQTSPVRYLEYVNKLRQLWNIDHKKRNSKQSMIIINTMGWGTGLGLELLTEIICLCSPNLIVQIGDRVSSTQNRNQMPDVTLEWLLEEPVFLPYRNKIQMNNKRQENYDGRLDYEYIKIQSAAVSNSIQKNKSKLRPRDHRLLGTWSYFFSSNLSRNSLPWSQFVHVLLTDKSDFQPENLQHSIVAFCSCENIEQLRSSSILVNDVFQLLDYENEIFQCLGFGWIENCNKETQTYEVFTPIDCLSDVNLLVKGAFDTPDEFQSVFRRSCIK